MRATSFTLSFARYPVLPLVAFATLLLACGKIAPSADTPDAGPAVAVTPNRTGDPGDERGVGDAAAPPADGDLGTPRWGTLLLSPYIAAAAFADGPDESCRSQTNGPCRVTTCALPFTDRSAPRLSAGQIRIDGTSSPIALMPDPAGQYWMDLDASVGAWSAGALVTFRAEGAQVPAFGLEVVAPSAASITSPVPVGGQIVVRRSEPLGVRWLPVDASVVVVELYKQTDSVAVTASCDFDATAGHETVPLACLSALPATGNTRAIPSRASIGTKDSARGVAGLYSIEAEVLMPAKGVDGADFSYELVLE